MRPNVCVALIHFISFMKDLATLRSPSSPYTFLSYLHSQDRLISFINRGSTIPTRKEYSDYLTWAAAKVISNGVNVKYGHEVIALDNAPDNTIQVRYRDVNTLEETVIRTRQSPSLQTRFTIKLTDPLGDLIISPGGSPRNPDFLQPFLSHPRVTHSSSYALKIGDMLQSLSHLSRPLRVAVIGSGQSAAEVTMDVRNRLASVPADGRHVVDMLIRKGSLKPSDDSPFANEIFDPACECRACLNFRQMLNHEQRRMLGSRLAPSTIEMRFWPNTSRPTMAL